MWGLCKAEPPSFFEGLFYFAPFFKLRLSSTIELHHFLQRHAGLNA